MPPCAPNHWLLLQARFTVTTHELLGEGMIWRLGRGRSTGRSRPRCGGLPIVGARPPNHCVRKSLHKVTSPLSYRTFGPGNTREAHFAPFQSIPPISFRGRGSVRQGRIPPVRSAPVLLRAPKDR